MLILGGSIDSELRKDLQRPCKDYLWECWSWGGQLTVNFGRICEDFARITSDSVDPGGWSTVNLGRIHKDFGRITFDSVDPGWVGWLTVNLGRIHKDFARITSDSVDPGGWSTVNLGRIHRLWKDYIWQCWSWVGGLIDSQLRKDPQRLCKDYLSVLILGVGQSTVNLGRICKDLARITSDSVDPGGGSIDSELRKDLQRPCKDYLLSVDPRGVNWQSTSEGSVKTLQGLPLTVLILGGLINSQLRKDPQRLCKDYLWQCWSWGVDRQWT